MSLALRPPRLDDTVDGPAPRPAARAAARDLDRASGTPSAASGRRRTHSPVMVPGRRRRRPRATGRRTRSRPRSTTRGCCRRGLAAEASWLVSAEAASALAYFVAPDLSSPIFEGFDHEVISLNWGSKRDHATWFSAEPSAITGIQLIPLSPSSVGYLSSEAAGGADHVDAVVAAAAPDGYDVPLGDFVLMYSALAGREQAEAAIDAIADLPDASIDDGNSRAYATAWVMAAAARG